MSAAAASLYETLAIQSNDGEKTVDIRLGTISIDYYEDIFSPTVTAKIKVVNTGDTIGLEKNDPNKRSLYNGLPLRGGERIAMKILDRGVGKTGLDFATDPNDYLYVSSITDVVSETQRESFTLHLVSREAITNETARVVKKYPTGLTIDDSVKKILTEVLKTRFDDNLIEKSQNKYGFIGNLRKPFTVLVWLASKAVPVSSGDATAGFVFYQTQDGFNFRSIQNLIDDGVKKAKENQVPEYVYTEVNESQIDRTDNNDFQITTYTTDRNQNLIEKLRLGTYASQRMFFNPLTFNFTTPEQGLFQYSNYGNKAGNLGDPIDLPPLSETSEKTLGQTPTRILSSVLDIGTMEKDVSVDKNADPSENQAQAIMRYNVLFTQTVSMTVPCNTNLRAGDVIKCLFPKISRNDGQEFDPDQSGLYMIKELCHHFDKTRSFTSMLLVRDTFGLYTGK
tara:strand:+ start:519 stop:1871 length:1353 start_codon:yes stop_codon:yes gene_type:complete